MNPLQSIFRFAKSLLQRRSIKNQIDEELDFHLQMRIESNLREWTQGKEPTADEVRKLQNQMMQLAVQSPTTLLRLRIFEIGVPLLLCVISLLLLGRYPLTEERVYEIQALLEKRKQSPKSQETN